MSELASLTLAWYQQNARRLPWRTPPSSAPLAHPDPYAVWVSEIMLQQTRVETVIPYFERWLELFPTIRALAQAPEQQVLAAWEGLGYYSRARNLHAAARKLLAEFDGALPDEPAQLRSLPGIGRYTAAAIASIAFNRDEATLDGNLRRVFARVFDVTAPADAPAGDKLLWELAAQHLPPGRAADYNQALMDLGATVCLPKKPLCSLCPLHDLCRACALGLQEHRPVLKPRAAVPHRLKAAAVIARRGRVLLNRRPSKGLLGGMWEFPSAHVQADTPAALSAAIQAAYGLELVAADRLGAFEHAYTHFKLTETAYRCQLSAAFAPAAHPSLKWVPFDELQDYPMGKVDRAIAKLIS